MEEFMEGFLDTEDKKPIVAYPWLIYKFRGSDGSDLVMFVPCYSDSEDMEVI